MNQTAIETTKDIATLNIEMEGSDQLSPAPIGGYSGKFEIIKRIVLDHYSLEVEAIKNTSRTPINVMARQLICYFTKALTPAKLIWIGYMIQRDHTTVIHGIKAIENRLSYDSNFRIDFNKLKEKIYLHPVFID